MRMKEVCEKTGLTDRAVRLYIENGLLSPAEESNYTGRRSIHFSDEDVAILEAVSTLRKADFSIMDIRTMQTSPNQINHILEKHKQKLTADIENKKLILQSLEKADGIAPNAYTEIADMLRRTASHNTLPKEDSRMHLKDFQQTIKNRIFSAVAFALLLIGVVLLTPLILQTTFVADTKIISGGGYDYVYDFTFSSFFKNIQLIASGLCMVTATVLLFLHVIRGKKIMLVCSAALCLLSVVTLLLLPEQIRTTLFRYEFLNYRHSFMWHIFYSASSSFDIFIQSLKFIPPICASILSFIGIIKQKDIDY